MPSELLDWCSAKIEEIAACEGGTHAMRCGVGLCKQLAEEIYPLAMWVNRCEDVDDDALLTPKIGSQPYDAEVVLISMATSGAKTMPRHIDFLFSRNRLNVAISMARCCSCIQASPRLLAIPCRTVEHLRLVNTLCWAEAYSKTVPIKTKDLP